MWLCSLQLPSAHIYINNKSHKIIISQDKIPPDILKNDTLLGTYLGYIYPGQDKGNYKYNITTQHNNKTIILYTEASFVPPDEELIKLKINKFKPCADMLNYTLRYKIINEE